MTPERVYSALLGLYPESFRLEYRESMLEAFRAVYRDNRRPAIMFWLFVAQDLSRSVCREHFREREPRLTYFARCAAASTLGIAALVGSSAVGMAAIGSPRALTDDLNVLDLRTGWMTAGVEQGHTKVVPSIAVTLKNVGSKPVGTVRLSAVFRRVGESKTWGGVYIPVVRTDGFPPHVSATPVLRSPRGYTGSDPLDDLLRNSQFVDVRVTVFAQHGAAPWEMLGEWPVRRELLEH